MTPQTGPSRIVQGRIILVQEQRFRLVTPTGRGFLLTLANGASVSMDDLRALAATRQPVCVSYTGEPNLASGVAHRVEPLEEQGVAR